MQRINENRRISHGASLGLVGPPTQRNSKGYLYQTIRSQEPRNQSLEQAKTTNTKFKHASINTPPDCGGFRRRRRGARSPCHH